MSNLFGCAAAVEWRVFVRGGGRVVGKSQSTAFHPQESFNNNKCPPNKDGGTEHMVAGSAQARKDVPASFSPTPLKCPTCKC